MKKGSVHQNNEEKNERKEIGVQNPKNEKKYNVKERIHVQLYGKLGDEKMKMNVEKDFCDWTIEEMVEYVLTGSKPMKKNV